jgi:catechol 2,3-dioxygenase-like lactoylglutathione lyase family enzyme
LGSPPDGPVVDGFDRQLPQGEEVFLDHVGYFVADLEAAGRALERLGFRVSPVNLQQNADAAGTLRPSGTSNRIALLRRGFIEMLAATHQTPLADQLRQSLARYAGIHLIALSHGDIPRQCERLTAAGFRMQEVVRLRRHKQTPQGVREVAWSVLRPEPGEMPEGRVQFALCHTPELTWPDDAPVPENGADALTDLLLCVADRREAAERFGRYVGRSPAHEANISTVPLDRGRLLFVEPAETGHVLPSFVPPAVPYMAGQALRSDVSRAREVLAKRGVQPLFADDELVCIGPADALGSYLLFHGVSVNEPWRALAARA